MQFAAGGMTRPRTTVGNVNKSVVVVVARFLLASGTLQAAALVAVETATYVYLLCILCPLLWLI